MTDGDLPTVLVVEDDDAVARTIGRALRGHALILHARTVEDARRLVREEAPLAVVTDVTLPDGSGFDVIAALRSFDATTAALVISGNTAFVNEAYKSDVKFLLKPFDARDVVDFVRHARARHAQLDGAIMAMLEEWTRRYALTRAEKTLLAAATARGTRKDLTSALGKGAETIKTHTRNLLAKTGHEKLSMAAVALLREALARAN